MIDDVKVGTCAFGKCRKERADMIKNMTDDEIKAHISHFQMVYPQLKREFDNRGLKWDSTKDVFDDPE